MGDGTLDKLLYEPVNNKNGFLKDKCKMQRKQKMRLSQLALVPCDKDEKGPRREEEIAKYRASV
ncbi:unnamed protein product [Lupinus luteus]|uniref:Uncharacterized protein n=1 Tax=Lupinus luteus TaxID=3873 RepID=A0AAV1YI61_LUPLU